ncbi:MAG: YgjP-like metallopeptidase domain-containing protein [Bacillota bacterium]
MKTALDMPVRIERRKGQKRLYIHAKEDHYLISAPARMPNRAIEKYLNDHSEEILSLNRVIDPGRRLYPADTLSLFGDTRPLQIVRGQGKDKLETSTEAYRFFTLKQTETTIKEALKKTLKKLLIEKLEALHEAFRQSHPGICDRPITFKTRYMKSRFGSAIPSKGIITVNLVFVHYEPALLRYIYAHEMAHFINPDHSPAFYRTLSTLASDHATLKRELKIIHDAYTTLRGRL